MPIGLGDRYEQQSVQLEPGDRVYLYSDGITEAMNPNKQLFGSGRLSDSLERGLAETVDWYRNNRDWWEPLKSPPAAGACTTR